ncbi:unnamed protein product, partial [Sphagnum compactum]
KNVSEKKHEKFLHFQKENLKNKDLSLESEHHDTTQNAFKGRILKTKSKTIIIQNHDYAITSHENKKLADKKTQFSSLKERKQKKNLVDGDELLEYFDISSKRDSLKGKSTDILNDEIQRKSNKNTHLLTKEKNTSESKKVKTNLRKIDFVEFFDKTRNEDILERKYIFSKNIIPVEEKDWENGSRPLSILSKFLHDKN